ncbi:folate-binding protein YgfZ [Corynebacterium lizhenjunii]|uniref:Folate-binding protein YgfZ n=1 Tax=Corynebacterium lizhenjunii TaxID=2709394 RepID=A0A7T0PBM6_9CORY|nr:folate-binding protein YgfZ [Corynebacterium lizhenjunii]QPK78882.1 folate-binding protein YgfZ [Corynebacterium lizhenjunii]
MNYVSPLLSRPGATPLQHPSPVDAAGVAWHYGSPLVEQRWVETGTVVVDRSHRRVLRVAGPDAAEFLNNLLSQKLVGVAPGFHAAALDLDMQGHILHAAEVTCTAPDEFYLDLPAAQAATLATFLQRMVFWSQVTVEETDLAVLSLLGAGLPELADSPVYSHPVPWQGCPRHDIAVHRGQVEGAVASLEKHGVRLAGLMAFSAERVRAREPELAADLDHKAIAHEVPHWIGRGGRAGAVHLDKGCYRGQETVARVENLGRSPRLLVMLYLDGSAPTTPEPGQDITLGGRRVGRMGTVVDDCDYGPIALGLVKRSALAAGTQLQCGDVALSVDPEYIPTDEGPQAGRVAVNNLRGR